MASGVQLLFTLAKLVMLDGRFIPPAFPLVLLFVFVFLFRLGVDIPGDSVPTYADGER